MSENVVVAVRCRPFNKREKELGCKCIIRMSGPRTTITEPQTGQTRDCTQISTVDKPVLTAIMQFCAVTFDYSYWSHNPEDPHYADNKKVFADIVRSVVIKLHSLLKVY